MKKIKLWSMVLVAAVMLLPQCVMAIEPPTSDYTYTVTGTTIDQMLMDQIAANAQAAATATDFAATIIIPAGNTVTVSTGTGSVKVPENMTVYFFGAESSTFVRGALVFPSVLCIDGYHKEISFENLDISSIESSDNKYIINQSKATSTGNITFTSCDIHDVNASVVRVQSAGGSIGTITLSDCAVFNQGQKSYPTIYNQATVGGINEVVVENSTFDTCVNSVISNNSKNDVKFNKVTIADCTFFNCIGSGKYLVDAGKNASSAALVTEIVIRNVVIGTPFNASAKGYQTAGNLTLDHVYQTAGWMFAGGSFKSNDGGMKLDWRRGVYTDDELFEDAANHNFSLKHWFEITANDEANGVQFDIYGDPRWNQNNGGTCGIGLVWTFNLLTKTLVIEGNGPMNDFSADMVPWRNCDINSVVISPNVTSIGNYAFAGFTGLSSIDISNSVTTIGEHAFHGCTGLVSINIPSAVQSIGEFALTGCTGLNSIIVDINNSVFDSRNNCNAIIRTSSNELIWGCKASVIPNSVEKIGDSAFSGCTALFSINIPNSVTNIGNNSFKDCMNLSSVILGNEIKDIGENAFGNISNLKDVYCYAGQVPLASLNTFENTLISNTTLHVIPVVQYAYQVLTPWKDFGYIVPLNDEDPKPTEICQVKQKNKVSTGNHFDLQGRMAYYIDKGIYIVKGKKVVKK